MSYPSCWTSGLQRANIKFCAILCLILHLAEQGLSRGLPNVFCMQFRRHNSTAQSTDGWGGGVIKNPLWLFLSVKWFHKSYIGQVPILSQQLELSILKGWKLYIDICWNFFFHPQHRFSKERMRDWIVPAKGSFCKSFPLQHNSGSVQLRQLIAPTSVNYPERSQYWVSEVLRH